jgi:hypothetical protein
MMAAILSKADQRLFGRLSEVLPGSAAVIGGGVSVTCVSFGAGSRGLGS